MLPGCVAIYKMRPPDERSADDAARIGASAARPPKSLCADRFQRNRQRDPGSNVIARSSRRNAPAVRWKSTAEQFFDDEINHVGGGVLFCLNGSRQ